MSNEITAAVVVMITLAAHYWLYFWVKFKMDEGTVLAYMQQKNKPLSYSIKQLALATKLADKRVRRVCEKSKKIHCQGKAADFFSLS